MSSTPEIDSEIDPVVEALVSFAHGFRFEDLTSESVDRCTLHIIDTFASLMAGFHSEAARSARNVARALPSAGGASVLGTSLKAQPDLAAFINATTSREAEQNDFYFPLAGGGNHPSDVLLPLFNAAEYAGRSGPDLMAAICVAYQIFLHISDQVNVGVFDQTMIAGIATAAGAGKLLGLPPTQLAECISIATIANNPLNQSRRNTLTMWKAAAAGQSGHAGVFAAFLAKAGMKGPSLPFVGKLGWATSIAKHELQMETLDPRRGHPLRLYDVMIKPRAACASAISSILAAEKAFAQIEHPDAISKVVVETYEAARAFLASGSIHWNPTTRESADHSIPYAVAATLVDGTAGAAQFMPERLFDPAIRQILGKIEVTAREDFTKANVKRPPEHHSRVLVTLANGDLVIGESGGQKGDMANAATAKIVAAKFRELCGEPLGASRAESALDILSDISSLACLDTIAPAFEVHDS